MKLALKLLQKIIDLPSEDAAEIRHLLDQLGLEVKNVEETHKGVVYTIETLANRGDHLSALGVAREIAAHTLSGVRQPQCLSELPQKKASLPVRRITDKCLRYALLEAEIPSPMQLRSDVAAFLDDPNALHPLVSILNYVQLELGQPMHAFDRDKIEGEIAIDILEKEQEIEALDSKKYLVPANSIVIKDKKKIVAVAGVIGCANSMITNQTKRVLIESALFCPITIRKTARKMGLVTDAAYAFERGVDPDGAVQGLIRVGQLLNSLAAAPAEQASHLIGFSTADEVIVNKPQIELSLALVRKQLGMPRLDELQAASRLKHLGYGVDLISNAKAKEVFKLTVPSWRIWDVESVEDIIEDIARSIGYSKIKLEMPGLDYQIPELSDRERVTLQLEPIFIGNGFLEVITKSFYSAKEAQIIEKIASEQLPKHLNINNSLENSYSHLKVTNIIHAAQLAEYNHRRGVQSVKAYEIGQLFGASRGKNDEYSHEFTALTIWQSGRWMEGEWKSSESTEDRVEKFVGIIKQLAAVLRSQLTIHASDISLYHPGCQGEIRVNRKILGHFGIIHPSLMQHFDLKQELLYAELDLMLLSELGEEPVFKKQSEFPAIKRDLTLRVYSKQLASDVERIISSFDGFKIDASTNLLNNLSILDDFKRENEDFRRVTYRLTFQSDQSTLEHSLIDGIMAKLFDYLEKKGSGVV